MSLVVGYLEKNLDIWIFIVVETDTMASTRELERELRKLNIREREINKSELVQIVIE